MSSPEMVHTDSSGTIRSDELRLEDLPQGATDGLLVGATAHPGARVVINSEVGTLGRPGLVSEGIGLGAITPSSDSDSDSNIPSSPEDTVPRLELDANKVILDGESCVGNEISAETVQMYTPRGRGNPRVAAPILSPGEKKKLEEKERKKEEKRRKEEEKRRKEEEKKRQKEEAKQKVKQKQGGA